MRYRRATCDSETIYRATSTAIDRINSTRELLQRMDSDSDKEKRLARQCCKVCHYAAGRIGGSKMTSAQCALCDNVMNFGNTCVDRLCKSCGVKHGLCSHCGGDIDMKHRRKKRELIRTETKQETE